MKAVILAGGAGTRMGPTIDSIPKPMVRIGNRPILWHIMKHYEQYNINDFILCLGNRGDVVRDYFLNYKSRVSDSLIMYDTGTVEHAPISEEWSVRLAETGENTDTGGRLKRIERYVWDDIFLATYGDSLSDVPIDRVLQHHRKKGLIATMSVMHSSIRFGKAEVEDGKVVSFVEKPRSDDWINGGFYVFSREIFRYLKDDSSLEYEVMPKLAELGQLAAYEHSGCHRAMDTPRDVETLNKEWETGNAAWKTW